MTLNDLNKKINDKNKIIILVSKDGSWTNIKIKKITSTSIEIETDNELLFGYK